MTAEAAPYYDPREVEMHNRFASALVDIEKAYRPGVEEMFAVLDLVEHSLGASIRAAAMINGGHFDDREMRKCVALRRLLRLVEKILANERAVAEALQPRRRGRAA